jgi:hypothetical protein
MHDGGDLPPDVELRRTERSVIARHVPTDISCHAASVPDAIAWLTEAVALHTGSDAAVEDPQQFLREYARRAHED